MFRQQGSRTDGQNRILAGYLAFVGGFVNSVGFVLIGTFTSHVTGHVGRAAHELSAGDTGAGTAAVIMVLTFFAGAFVASLIVESKAFSHPSRAYAVALAIEAVLLLVFAGWSRIVRSSTPRLQDVQALLLCASMGMQNSLVTRLSGAVVRTTHLTGVATDLGIEAARWFRHLGRRSDERPLVPKLLLLLTIASAFVCGAASGAVLVHRWMHMTMGVAAIAVALFAAYAARFVEEDVAKSRR